jgi:hypothetical protein
MRRIGEQNDSRAGHTARHEPPDVEHAPNANR